MYSIIQTIVTAYYKKSHYKKKISWVVIISFLTTFLSTVALGIALAIINGFQESTEIKMKGIHSDITIDGYGVPLNEQLLLKTITQEFPQIHQISFYSIEQCLINNSIKKTTPQTALFLGIEPSTYCKTNALKTTIVTAESLDTIFEDKKIIIGSSMAETLGLTQGSIIDCIIGSFDSENDGRVEFNKEKLIVGAIFKTGIEEFDHGVIFSSLETLQSIYPDSQVTQAACLLEKNTNPSVLKKKLEERLSLHVMCWQDYYPALVSAMNLENKICTFIFILIVFMAALTNGALLLLYITYKKRDIAVLQLLGVKVQTIQAIFIVCGLCLQLFSALLGIVCAAILSFIATYYQIFKLPEAYYIDYVIFSFHLSTAFFVFLVSFLTTILISYFTTKVLNRSNILDNLDVN
jgi:lipoprotein-releasing system permease protein